MSRYARNVAKVVALTAVATIGVVTHDALDTDNLEKAYGAGFDCYDEQEDGFIDNVKDFSVSPNNDFILFVREDGTAWFRGSNTKGQGGQGNLTNYDRPVQVKLNKKVKRVFATIYNSFFLTEDGKVYSCGANNVGQCGIGTMEETAQTPTLVEGLEDIVDVCNSGGTHSNVIYFKTSDNKLYLTGAVGVDRFVSPAFVTDNVQKICPSVGNSGVYILKNDSSLYVLGSVDSGSYGSTPVKAYDNVKDIVGYNGNDYLYVITYANDVVKFGGKYATTYDALKQNTKEIAVSANISVWTLGIDGKVYSSTTRQEVPILQNVEIRSIFSQGGTAYFLSKEGDLYAVGNNSGKFGNGATATCTTPVKIASNIRDVFPSRYFAYFLTRDGRLLSGGENNRYAFSTNNMLHSDESSIIAYGTTKAMNSIDNDLNEFKKFGAKSTTLYGTSYFDDKLMGYAGEGNVTLANFVEEGEITKRQVLPNGMAITTMSDGSIYVYNNLSTVSGTKLALNSSDIDHFELGYLDGQTINGEETEVLLAFKSDGSVYYLPSGGSSLTKLTSANTIVNTIPYRGSNAQLKGFYYVKSTGDIGYYTSGRAFKPLGISKNDIKTTIPCTSNSSDIYLMNDGTLKYIEKGVVKDITLPSGYTAGRVLSNRFVSLTDSSGNSKIYYIYNNTLKATNYTKSDVLKVCNDVIMFKDDTIWRANGSSLTSIDVAPDFIINLVPIDNNNTYILNDDGSTYGVGNLIGESSLLDFDIDYNEIAGFISNNDSSPNGKLLIMKDGTVYATPNSWTKSSTIHLTSSALQNVEDSDIAVSFEIVDNGLDDATSAVEQAEADIVDVPRASSTEADISSAQILIDECVDKGADIGDLQDRLNYVQNYVNADDAVAKAETSKLSTDIQSARDLITEALIPNADYRQRLTARLDALESLIEQEAQAQGNVDEALRAMKEELQAPMKSAYDTANTSVSALPSSTLKTNLESSLKTVLEYHTKFKPVQVEVEEVVNSISSMTIDNVADVRAKYDSALNKVNTVLNQDYKNTSTLRGMLTDVNSDIEDKEKEKADKELQDNALALLEKAEADIVPDLRDADTESDIELADEAISQLTGTLKTQYNTRLTQVKNYVTADDLVTVAEESLLASDVSTAKSANSSTKIKNASYRERFTNRLNAITNLNKALVGMKTKLSEDMLDLISTASDSIALVSDDIPAKENHLTMLDEVQGFYDVFNPVEVHVDEVIEQADTVTSANVVEVKANYDSALEEVNTLVEDYDAENEGYTNILKLKSNLEKAYRYIDSAEQDRQAEIREKENNAEELVNEAYALRLTDKTTNFTALKTAYDKADTAVSDLSDDDSAEKKEALSSKLEEINSYYKRLLNAETKVVSAETASPKTQTLVDKARTYIQDTTVDVPLVDTAENTLYLLGRLQDVQADIDKANHDKTVADVQVKLDELLALRYTDVSTNYIVLQSKIEEVQNEVDSKFIGDSFASDKTNFIRQIQEVSQYRGILLDAESKVITAETEPLEQSKVTTACDFITSSSLKQDATNTLALLSRLTDVDSEITHRGELAEAESNATSLVEKAEELQYTDVKTNFTDLKSAYDTAKSVVNALTDESATVKADLTGRLEVVNTYYTKLLEAETKVVGCENENPKLQESVDSAKEYISSNLVSGKANTDYLLGRLRDVQADIDRANHDKAVERIQLSIDELLALRYTDVSVNYTNLRDKIADVRSSIETVLADSSFDAERTSFTSQVDDVEQYRGILLDAESKVVDAEATPRSQEKVDTARSFITSSSLKQDAVNTKALLDRLVDVENALILDAQSNAENLVQIAEQARYTDLASSLLTKTETARSAVDNLGDGAFKSGLSTRLDAVMTYYNRLNEAEQKVSTAETSKTRENVNNAKTYITDISVEVPLKQDADNTLALLSRLGIVEDDITAEENRVALEDATSAVEEAEKARYTGSSENLLDKYNIADTKVGNLVDSSEKVALRGRLNIVNDYYTKLKNAEDKVSACENETPKSQSSVDSARQYINDNLKSDADNTKALLNRLIDVEDEINHSNRINNLDALIREAEEAEKTDLARDLKAKYDRANDKLSELGESDISYTGFKDRLDKVLEYHGKLNEAETQVANAERDLDMTTVTNAEGYINSNLFPRDEATNTGNLLDRLDIVKDIIRGNEDLRKASEAVTKAENTMTYTDFNTAQDLVTALEPSDGKTNLQNRLDTLADKMQDRLNQAIQAVEQAEANPTDETVSNGYNKVNVLPDDCSEKQGLLDRLDILQAKLDKEKKEQEAEKAVEKAEDSLKQEDIDSAREKVNGLDDGAKKDELNSRLDAVQDLVDKYAKAEEAVEKAEESLKQADVDSARELVNQLPDGAKKDELNARLDEVQRIIDNLLAEATKAVEKVENTLSKTDFGIADNLVSKLEDGVDRGNLQARLDAVKDKMQALIDDATNKVVSAEQQPSRDAVNTAQTAIDKLPSDYDEKQPLQDRLNKVIEGLNLGDLIDLATKAVEKAESTRDITDINSAQDLVNKLPKGDVKDALQKRLDDLLADINLQDLIDKATEMVEKAEAERTQVSKDEAQTWVNKLPVGEVRKELQDRLDAIIIETPKTSYTQEELQQILNEVVASREVGNDTTMETLADDIKTEFTRRTNVAIDLFINNWQKIDSNSSSDGSISGGVVGIVELSNLNSAQLQTDMNLVIKKVPIISSSSSHKTTTVVHHSGVNFQLIGIARNDIASDVSVSDQETIESGEKDLLSSSNDALQIVNVPYLEKLTSDDGSVNGTMQLLNIKDSTVGMILTGEKDYATDTVVSINTDAEVEGLKVYTYLAEIDKYVEVNTDISKEDGVLKFRGTGKSKYILSTIDLSDSITANQNWNEVEGNNWTYVKGQDVASNWITDTDNNKYYIDSSTHLMKDGWLQDKGNWYYLNPISDGTRGAMKTGWVSTTTEWYFMSQTGEMQTGWIKDRGAWYHLNESSGSMDKGWIKDNGKWYYTEVSGVMLTGYHAIDGVVYHFDESGALLE